MPKKSVPRRRQKTVHPVSGIKVELFPKLRKQLYEADSVVYATRFALEYGPHTELDPVRLATGLERVGDILNEVVGEIITLGDIVQAQQQQGGGSDE